jgi:hypothetical protein
MPKGLRMDSFPPVINLREADRHSIDTTNRKRLFIRFLLELS